MIEWRYETLAAKIRQLIVFVRLSVCLFLPYLLNRLMTFELVFFCVVHDHSMHDGMQYDLIKGQGHELLKVGNPSIFKSYLLLHLQWELATDH